MQDFRFSSFLSLNRLTVFFIASHLVLSIKAWLPLRTYPRAELINLPVSLIPAFEVASFTVLAMLLLISFIKQYRSVMGIILLIFSVYFLTDLSRFHPALYQYLFILLCYVLIKDKQRFFAAILLFLSATYFWSGFNKINASYYTEIISQFMYALAGMPEFLQYIFAFALILAPFMEIAAGLALYLNTLRRSAVIFLVLMHSSILFVLISLDYNQIVWPWNLYNIFLLLVILRANHQISINVFLASKLLKITFLLVCLSLPVLGALNLADQYLAFNLYSGRCFKLKFFRPGFSEHKKLPSMSVTHYSNHELNLPVHCSETAQKLIAEKICERFKNKQKIYFNLYSRPAVFSKDRKLILTKHCQ